MKTKNVIQVAFVSSLLVVGCGLPGTGNENGQGDNIGEITLDLTLAPSDARCVVITVTPQTGPVVTRTISVTPQQSTVFSLSGLPTGTVTLAEQAYTQACSAIAGQSATWVSDPVTVTLQAGAPVTVSFSLRRVDSGGQVTIISDFPTPPQTFRVFPVAGAGALVSIATGSDGALWFTDQFVPRIGRITISGNMTTFPLTSSTTQSIVAGPDGALWFTEPTLSANDKIGRMTTAGALTEFPVPTANGFPWRIAAGADGNLWFTELSSGKVGRVTPSGVVTEFSPPTANSSPQGIAAGPDGNMWFAEQAANRIARVTPAGTFTEFVVPTPNAGVDGMTGGPDGNVWFTESSRIGRITPTGSITEFLLPTPNSSSRNITAGPDGNLWFTEQSGPRIGKITPAGVITEFAAPDGANPNPFGITAGPDGNLWYVEANLPNVVQIHL